MKKVDQKIEVTTLDNHPFRHDIIGKSKETLLTRKPYVVSALNTWKNNKLKRSQYAVKFNVNYFEIELQLINKELAKFE